ncbi:MAG: ribulose-phosphate 3-epimerase [Anaerolineae bacterium]
MSLRAELSLWSADLTRLADDIARIDAYADVYHIDVADAHFVPGLLFFPDLVAAIRSLTKKPFHVHMMVDQPEALIEPFAEAGADIITVHVEVPTVGTAVDDIIKRGLKAGLAIKIETPLESVIPYLDRIAAVTLMGTALGIKGVDLSEEACPRIERMRALLQQHNAADRVAVVADGGIRQHTVPKLRAAGADAVVMGSLAFKSTNLEETFAWLRGH